MWLVECSISHRVCHECAQLCVRCVLSTLVRIQANSSACLSFCQLSCEGHNLLGTWFTTRMTHWTNLVAFWTNRKYFPYVSRRIFPKTTMTQLNFIAIAIVIGGCVCKQMEQNSFECNLGRQEKLYFSKFEIYQNPFYSNSHRQSRFHLLLDCIFVGYI